MLWRGGRSAAVSHSLFGSFLSVPHWKTSCRPPRGAAWGARGALCGELRGWGVLGLSQVRGWVMPWRRCSP